MNFSPVVKVSRNVRELGSWAPQNCRLALMGPKFTKFLPELWSFWLPRSWILPETVLANNFVHSHYLLLLQLQMYFKIYLLIFTIHYHNWNSQLLFILHSLNAVIKFRDPSLVIWPPIYWLGPPNRVPGPPVLQFNHCCTLYLCVWSVRMETRY